MLAAIGSFVDSAHLCVFKKRVRVPCLVFHVGFQFVGALHFDFLGFKRVCV